jgi:hypothetical protein
MAKPPSYPPIYNPGQTRVEDSRFIARAAGIAFAGQFTAMAKAPRPSAPETWFPHKKFRSPVPLRGISCALPPNGGAVFSEGKRQSTTYLGRTLSSFALATAEASLVETRNGYVTQVRSVAEDVQIGVVSKVTFPLSQVVTRWTYVDEQSPRVLDLQVAFDGYRVGKKGTPVPIPIAARWERPHVRERGQDDRCWDPATAALVPLSARQERGQAGRLAGQELR